jgi:hypothetical protein
MSNLRRRLAAAEARMRAVKPSIVSVVIVNDPEPLGDSVGMSVPNQVRYQRQPSESLEAFRDRAASEAERAGETVIIFSQAN